MAEKTKAYRLFKVAKELNVGSSTLVEHLVAKGFDVNNSPNEKLSAEMYDVLLKDFADEKVLKERVEQLREEKAETNGNAEETVTEEEEILTANDLRSGLLGDEKGEGEETEEKKEEEPVAKKETKAKTKKKTTKKEEKEPEEEEDKSGLKVVGKIDLESLEKPSKKKAKKKEEEPKKEEPKVEKEEPADTEEPTEEETPEKVIRASENAPKLGGLTVVGKIDLPKKKEAEKKTEKSDDDDASGTKRKRRRKRKKTNKVSPSTVSNRGDGKKTDKKKEELTDKEIQEQIKKTLANLEKRAGRTRQRLRRQKRDESAAKRAAEDEARAEAESILEVTEFITANELANLLSVSVTDIITKCMELGLFVSINQRLEADVIQLLGEEYGFEVKFIDISDKELEVEEEEDLEDTDPRAPIVTVMGHVDHGKTSLLDYIRDSNVIAGEAGGITQHIGAYGVELKDGKQITFLDTPGHEAFTAMRARGAKVTDLAIIVIAGDDSVMPQTKEAINHAQAAGVPMVFAFNKMDKEGANADKIKEQLSQINILTEDWGGKHQSQEISAKTGQGIDELLEKVLLEAELLDLKANGEKRASGTVIEAKKEVGRGNVATVLVQNGTLRVGDCIVAGVHFGKIKALADERGARIEEAGPSEPAVILGLNGIPQAGDMFRHYESERKAKEVAQRRQELFREQSMRQNKHITLEEIARRKAIGDFRELNIVIKGDVDGSIEALADSLLKLSTEEVQVNVLLKAVGQISESDVLLASASDAIIVGFQVRPSVQARKLAETEGIDIRLYRIIYDAINDVKDALEGLLSPEIKEEILGSAEIREVFRITKVGNIAGCYVTDGKIQRNNPVRLIREGIVVFEGNLSSLKRIKDDVREVVSGYECGIGIENYNDIKVGDVIESYHEVETKRTL